MRKASILSSFIILCITTLLGSGCNTAGDLSTVSGHGLPLQDSCRFEPGHHYLITLPDPLEKSLKYPLIIAIDPHGDGMLAVQNFKTALNDQPVIIASSLKIKNNDPEFLFSLTNLYNDLLEKYPVDPENIIIAGFSGGARMALEFGRRNPVKGILMYGAGPGQLQPGFQEKEIYAVSGTRDFNFSEQYRPLFTDLEVGSGYLSDYFRGTHEWPPAQYIRETVIYILREVPGPWGTLCHTYSGHFLLEADSLQNTGDYFFAGKALEKAYFFSGSKAQREAANQRINEFRNSPEWIDNQHEIENFMRMELQQKRLYAQNLQDPDMAWWKNELENLFDQIENTRDPFEQDYYYRLKGFLGIYLYSRIHTLLQQGNTSELMDRLLTIYERVEPTSEDLQKFKYSLSLLREVVR